MLPLSLLMRLLAARRGPARTEGLRYLSLCSGIEAVSVAVRDLGWQPLAFSEIEAFPSAVLAHHWPEVPNLGDMTKWREWPERVFRDADVLAGGTPCFAAGHLVLREDGYVPIESIRAGDMVVSHTGRLCRVARTGSKQAPVGVLMPLGRPEGVVCTPDHPLLTVAFHMQSTRRDGQYVRLEHCGEPEWTKAEDFEGRSWCALTKFGAGSDDGRCRTLDHAGLVSLAGWYAGDGWTRSWGGKSKKAVCLGLTKAKYVVFLTTFPELPHTTSAMPTGVRVTICDTEAARWLEKNFGRGAHNKKIPAWLLSDPDRRAFLTGYEQTDGHHIKGGKFSASTVSRPLAMGIAALAETLEMTSSVKFCEMPPTTVIEGRTVNQSSFWRVTWSGLHGCSKARVRHDYLLRKIRSFVLQGEATVYNIEVEGDHSYVLDGMAVHNCQAFSVAGLRNSLDDERGNLTLTYAHILDHIDRVRAAAGLPAAICLWENVPGVLNTKDNAFGCFLAGLAGEDLPLEPPGGRWTDAGYVRGPQRAIAWRCLDAQYFGLAQRRKRVFVVASAGAIHPEQVLLEWEGVRRDSPPSREAGQGVTPQAASGAAVSSGRGWWSESDVGATVRAQESASKADTLIPQVCPTLRAGGNTTGGHRPPGTDVDTCESLIPQFWNGEQVTQTLDAVLEKGQTMPEKNGFPAVLVPRGCANQGHFGTLKATNVADPLRAKGGDTGNGGECLVAQAVSLRGREGGATAELGGEVSPAIRTGGGGGDKPHVLCITGDITHALDTANGGKGSSEDGTGRGVPTVAFEQRYYLRDNKTGGAPSDTAVIKADAAKAGDSAPCVAFTTRGRKDGLAVESQDDLAYALKNPGDGGRSNDRMICRAMQVRRLTPTECERLQGFPDGHTMIPWRGRPAEDCPDGPRYKALGNSMAVPVIRWICERIDRIRA